MEANVADGEGGVDGTPDAPLPRGVLDHCRSAVPYLEGAISLVLVGLSSMYLMKYASELTRSSLWTDELYTILEWGGTDPWYAATHYQSANNHVLTNVLTAAIPGDNFDPLHARFWSFVSVFAAQGVMVWAFVRRGQHLLGSVIFYVFAVNAGWVDLGLQARGYGMMALCGVVATVAAWRYLEEGRDASLVWMAVATWIGAWTLPSFLFFAVPLWALVFAVVRRRRILAFVLAAGAATFVVYLPIMGQLYVAFRDYGDTFGRGFTTASVGETFTGYLLTPVNTGYGFDAGAVWVRLAPVLLLPQLLHQPRANRQFVGVVIGAVVAFFSICLVLETPIVRTAAFVVAPVALACLVSVSAAVYHPKVTFLRPLLALVVVLALNPNIQLQREEWNFLPREPWLETAREIEDRFPEGTQVYMAFDAQYLAVYLSDEYVLVEAVDPQAFDRGEVVVVERGIPRPDDPDLGVDGAEVIEVPGVRDGGNRIFYVPQPSSSG